MTLWPYAWFCRPVAGSGYLSLLALLLPLYAANVCADQDTPGIDSRHGILGGWDDADVEGGLTLVAQGARESDVDPDFSTSLDLLMTLSKGPDKLVVYVEGSSTPRSGGIASLIPDANADSGTALDSDGNGRLQVSEFHYRRRIDNSDALVIGLINPSTSLDISQIANDETTQFLNTALVNNPTIAFPDYTLGLAYECEYAPGTGFSLVLSSSNGLADNPNASYSQLLDVTDDGKGIFAAIEIHRQIQATHVTAGAWINSADHEKLNPGAGTESNYGIYTSIDGSLLDAAWNLRLGLANDAVSSAADFQSIAIEYPLKSAIIGTGLTRTGLSDKGTSTEQNASFATELYVRFFLADDISLTPSFQWLKNIDIGDTGTRLKHNLSVYSLRLGYQY